MKNLFILLFVGCIFLTTKAQNLSVPYYGIKVGYNHSSFNFTQYNYLFFGLETPTEGYAKPSQIANSGIKAGLFIDVKISKRWHISPTVSFSQFGAENTLNQQWDNTYDGDTIRTNGFKRETFSMDYITLDPLFEYRPTDRITLNVGPSVSYLISNNLVRYVEEEGSERTVDALNSEIPGVNNIDVGLNIGTSFFITEHLDIDINAYIGMMEFENVDDGSKTLSFSISCGYTFN